MMRGGWPWSKDNSKVEKITPLVEKKPTIPLGTYLIKIILSNLNKTKDYYLSGVLNGEENETLESYNKTWSIWIDKFNYFFQKKVFKNNKDENVTIRVNFLPDLSLLKNDNDNNNVIFEDGKLLGKVEVTVYDKQETQKTTLLTSVIKIIYNKDDIDRYGEEDGTYVYAILKEVSPDELNTFYVDEEKVGGTKKSQHLRRRRNRRFTKKKQIKKRKTKSKY
jgi:hypothetical protein